MNEDLVFRLTLIAIIVVIFPVGMYHRVKSRRKGEQLDRRQEGLFILVTLRPIAAVCELGVLAWLINPRWIAWSAVELPEWLQRVGVVIAVAAAVLLVWTFRSLGRNITDTVVTREDHTLVTTGPYRWVRHPLYLAMFLFVAAVSLMTRSWLVLVTGALACGLIVLRTGREEERLLQRFGEAYRAYMKRTGRFLPRRRKEAEG